MGNKTDIYKRMFDMKESAGKVFTVEIIACENSKAWYSDKIGQEFSVIDKDDLHLQLVKMYNKDLYIDDCYYIKKREAIITSL